MLRNIWPDGLSVPPAHAEYQLAFLLLVFCGTDEITFISFHFPLDPASLIPDRILLVPLWNLDATMCEQAWFADTDISGRLGQAGRHFTGSRRIG